MRIFCTKKVLLDSTGSGSRVGFVGFLINLVAPHDREGYLCTECAPGKSEVRRILACQTIPSRSAYEKS